MNKINLHGKKIRLFFHTDIDGTISANLIQLFSGAKVVALVPCPYQNYPKPAKVDQEVLDVFVDARAKDRNEDVRIDHHASGEDADYLKRDGILLDTNYKSAVSLVAHYLGLNINKQILEEMDKVDSGIKNVFSKFMMDNYTIHKIMFKPGFNESDYQNFEIFKDKLLGYMAKGFAIEDLEDTLEGYEQKLELAFKVVFEDIKYPGKPLIKIVHTPVHEGIFAEAAFKITDNDFFENVLPYVQQHYYEESKKGNLGIYTIIGFRARNSQFDEQCIKVIHDTHPEPYQIFVSRSNEIATLNIGALIAEVKKQTGIVNGGGRDSVGGMNTGDKDKAIHALKLILEHIKKHAI